MKDLHYDKERLEIHEPDGTVRKNIGLLYFGQMTKKDKVGRRYYADNFPDNYFQKAEILRENGWNTWYNYDNWVHNTWTDIDYKGVSTDAAIKITAGEKQ